MDRRTDLAAVSDTAHYQKAECAFRMMFNHTAEGTATKLVLYHGAGAGKHQSISCCLSPVFQ